MEQRVAIVTGSSRGLGFEISRKLAEKEGIRVILTARNVERGQAAVARLRADGLGVQFHHLEVTDQGSVRRLVKHIADHYGRLDILVNSASIYVDRGLKVTEMDLAIVRQTLEVNFYGPLRLCQILVPLMQRHGYGRIVNLSSSMASFDKTGGGALAYRTSKAALNMLTRVLAAELEASNILVNSMDPGAMEPERREADASYTLASAAETAVWLATLPREGPTGGFFRDRQPVPW